MIDASEFARVFPDTHKPQASSQNSDEKPFEQSVLAAETQILRETVAELKADKAKLNERLDHAEQERDRLLKVIKSQNEQMRLLTDQQLRKQLNPSEQKARRRMRWLWGRD